MSDCSCTAVSALLTDLGEALRADPALRRLPVRAPLPHSLDRLADRLADTWGSLTEAERVAGLLWLTEGLAAFAGVGVGVAREAA